MYLRSLLSIAIGAFLITSCAERVNKKLSETELELETTKEAQQIKETAELPTVETAFEFIKKSGGIEEYRCTLNDLTILLLEDHSAPVVTFMVTYHVGSRNEAVGHTGSTHLLEHMMFKGTEKYNKENGNDITSILQSIGAQINATTWNDRTNYYALLPSEHLNKVIEIEADRMRNLLLKDEDRQPEMTVVRNEFEQGENDPFSALNKNIWATAYQAHPYHHSTIGWRSDIEGVSTERLKQFYDIYYWPNNATVTAIGDFEKEETLQKILDEYGSIPRSPNPIPEMYTTEPEQEGARRLIVKRSGETGIVGIAHKTPEGLNEDYFTLQVLARILGEGKSSRLYKKLVDKGLATSLFMWDYPFKDNGLFITYAFLTPETKHEEVEKIILDEYELIKTNGITDQELARAKGQTEAQLAYVRDGSFSVASVLNEAIAIGDWTNYTKFLEKTNTVTKEDVQEITKKYLIEDQSTTGHFVPIKGSGGGGGGMPPQKNRAGQFYNFSRESDDAMDNRQHSGANIADNIVEFEPVKGLRLLTMKTGVQDVVTIRGSTLGGDVFSPQANRMIADLTAAMLDKGTRSKSKFEIADRLESVGATMSFSSGQQHVRFSIKCLKNDIPLVLDLLAEQLREPAFNKEDLSTLKTRLKGNLKRDKKNTGKMAGGEFIRELYPKDHPNYRYPIDERIEMIEKIDPASLRNFHKTYYGLGNMIMTAVGDVDGEYFSSEVEKVFKGWKTSPLSKWANTMQANDVTATKKYVTIKDKTSADVYIGLPIGIDRDHKDYYPLMIGTYILGGNFSARLMQTVRDEQGLTYGIYSQIQGAENGNDGFWTIWSSFAPQLLQTGYEASLEQLEKWVTEGIIMAELEAKKTTITGSYKVGLATTRGLASQILSNAERGRSNEYLDQYPGIINELTPEQVNRAIKQYIDIGKLVFVAAGSVDKTGKPLE